MKIFKKLEKNIKFIINKKDEEIKGNFYIKKVLYCNDLILSLFIGNDRVSARSHKVNYDCPTCSRNYTILLKKLLTKTTMCCNACKEQEPDKKRNQSEYIKNSFAKYGKIKNKKISNRKSNVMNSGIKSYTIEELITLSNESWNNETQEFKVNYNNRVLLEEDMLKIKNKLIINDIHLSGIENLEFFDHLLCNNKSKYCSYFLINNELISASQYSGNIKYICDGCDSVFIGRYIKSRSKLYKIFCRKCNFCNKVFKIRKTNNCVGEIIKYQSKLELGLIEWCNCNDIIINNGSVVDYYFNGKDRKYHIDFRIGDLLIETKDNHIWHQNEVSSGKWKLKEESAVLYSNENNLKYLMIFPDDMAEFKKTLLKLK